MRVMEISGKTGKSRIIVGESIEHLPAYVNAKNAVIVTDANVRRLHARSFPGWEVIEIGLGEENKTLETVEKIYRRFLELELDRSSFVVGIGGGIVCDVAGFAASTYMRGLPFGFVPSTLIAQADAAVGGKNGVNFMGYKNLVGSFSQPAFVLCDFELLKTLPRRELRCGFAEIIKHAAIADERLFAYLEENMEAAMSLKKTVVEKVVHDSLSVKAAIVSCDEVEKGERMKLNFGHTLGHAIEKCAGLPHGEAISIGMAAAADLSVKRGMLAKKDAERLAVLLAKARLPTKLQGKKSELLDAIRKDKKRFSQTIRMALLEGIGKAKITEIPIAELEGVLNDLC